jgi:hypothetical protein
MTCACGGFHVLQRAAGCVEWSWANRPKRRGGGPSKEDGTVHFALLAATVPDAAVGAKDAIPMCMRRKQQRCLALPEHSD